MKKKLTFIIAVIITVFMISCKNNKNETFLVKLIPVKNAKDFQYIDLNGKIVINPQFSNATIFRDGIALVKSNGDNPKWGYISEDGKYIIPAKYKYATIFSEDLAWVVSENTGPTAINKKGEIKITLKDAQAVNIFKEGFAAVNISDSSEGKWGFVDKEGKMKINPQFKHVGNFNNGRCPVENKEGKWGYIDKEGKIIINYQFDGAFQFKNNIAIVKLNEKYGSIDINGKYIINPQYSNMLLDGDIYLIEQDKKWGWCDNSGKILINPQFDDALPYNGNKLAAVKSDKLWGYIDKEGKIAINPQFDEAFTFNGTLALVVSSKKIGFIDDKGKYIINPQFDSYSYDYIYHAIIGQPLFQSVVTDYFDYNIIINRIKKDILDKSICGVDFNTPISRIMQLFYKTETDFSIYSNKFYLISNGMISKDISYDFYIYSNVKTTQKVSSGWYSYNTEVLNKSALPYSLSYIIKLSGKAEGKEKELLTEIAKTFNNLEKDPQSTENNIIFKKKDNITVNISIDNSEINITYLKN